MKWIVVQGLSRKSVPALIAYGNQVAKRLQESAWFPLPFPGGVPSPDVLQQDVAKLLAASVAPYTGKTKTDAVRLAREIVENHLFLIGYCHVANIANRDNQHGSSIIFSAGMNYRVHGKRKPYTFKVKNTKQQKAVKATAARTHRDSVYCWEIKRMYERNFREAAKTFTASYIFKELASGERYHFRVRTITPRRGIDTMSQVLELVVL
jgi:hypothetical protein